ncbi:hypothetical protein ElyMa_001047900 [Elysia marginata]|uniref:Uncharacterized protein n=1 Tax=Elysia marginata TaxID=1093978 RepID=A0AAV4HP99_9GAST|nr:hypothetical protein ElyMa_001047900 [Elysia marginata]
MCMRTRQSRDRPFPLSKYDYNSTENAVVVVSSAFFSQITCPVQSPTGWRGRLIHVLAFRLDQCSAAEFCRFPRCVKLDNETGHCISQVNKSPGHLRVTWVKRLSPQLLKNHAFSTKDPLSLRNTKADSAETVKSCTGCGHESLPAQLASSMPVISSRPLTGGLLASEIHHCLPHFHRI